MRLKIAHQLAFLLLAAVLLTMLIVGGLGLWNLRSGFSDYLRQRDSEQLMRLVKLLEARAAQDPDLNWLRRNERKAMRDLIDGFYDRSTSLPPLRRPPPEGRPPLLGDAGHPPPPPPPPPPLGAGPQGSSALRDRVGVFDADGIQIGGRPLPAGEPIIRRAILVNGQIVGYATLLAEPVPDDMDQGFLRRQYQGLAWAALGTALLSVLAAWWVARLWSAPLRRLQLASRAIAQGQRGPHIPPSGAVEIAELTDDVNTMTDELARLEASRRRWIAQISHELRTPLAVLRGELESIEDGVRQATPKVITSLREEVMQLTRLVHDLHTLSVADIDGLPCHFTEGDAHGHLRNVAQRFMPKAQQQGLQLHLVPCEAAASSSSSAPCALPTLTVCWDFGRIEQLLSNLLTNSLRYTQAPGQVWVDWHCDGQQFTLTVEDSPPGVRDDELTQLFEPLYRTDTARRRDRHHEHGSGLGLSIVRTIVMAHQGRVWACHSEHGGLKITACWPLRPTPAAQHLHR
ncbi:MAG: hypothetical protein RLZZ612_15 [Pseudomonadota bacterium]|jgi:two-component system sensor histidine kinase BaeS